MWLNLKGYDFRYERGMFQSKNAVCNLNNMDLC